MSNYDKAIRTVSEVKTMSSHMVALGKIRAVSEDLQLNYLIQSLVVALQYPHLHGMPKHIPTSLTFWLLPETQRLLEYCQYQSSFKKPEWQILAERHGWIAPTTSHDRY